MESCLPPLLLLLLALVAFSNAAHELPSSLKTCKQTEQDYNGCLKRVIQDAVKVLAKGLPTLGLPPIEPMHFKQIKIEDTPERPVTLNIEANDLDIGGMGNAVIDEIEMKPGSYHIKGKAHTDTPITLRGKYKADGKILVLPIKGEGECDIIIPRIVANLEVIGKPVERDGETYWDVTDFKVDLNELNNLKINLTGLYNNDKTLSDNTLKFMNENSGEMAGELKPALNDALGVAFGDMSKRVFDKVPYNLIFPPA